jgi:hypothetical protein
MLEFDNKEPLDLEPLYFEIQDAEMHAAQPELDPEAFPGGPLDKFVLTEYGDHIARCIYENVT